MGVMTADQVIALRRSWQGRVYTSRLPDATVLAEPDWLLYVQAMAATVPVTENVLVFPTREEAAWAWPEGVAVVFSSPIELDHVIVSEKRDREPAREVDPHSEMQSVAALAICAPVLAPSQTPEGEDMHEVEALPLLWIGVGAEDVVTGWWTPGRPMMASPGTEVSGSARLVLALVSALGHRLTRLAPPVTAGRGERRRVARDLPSLRVLELASGAKGAPTAEPGSVEWSHRWMVRGHWRLQPHGPRRELRRIQWVDPYVKGPEDKPLEVRPTVWRTGPRPEAPA